MRYSILVNGWLRSLATNAALPSPFRNTSRRNGWRIGADFWCPNGHEQAYVKSEAQRLREQLEEQKRSTEWWKNSALSKEKTIQGQKISLGKAKAKLKRTETRVAHGVCPCCNRSFVNMQRHMKTKHPDYVEGSDVR